MATPDTRGELLSLYKHALDVHRAEVSANWDRQKFFLTLNLAIAGAAAALLKAGDAPGLRWALGGVLVMDATIGIIGAWAIDVGHAYARNARLLFQAWEERLELPMELRMGITPGMRGATPETYARAGSLTFLSKLCLRILAGVELVMAGAILWGGS